jgi:hypothetical protein
MSEQQNRIATLLNSDSSTTAAPTTATTTPDTVTYDIPAGKDATAQQLGVDSTADALISVDGHQVAAGDNGLSVDIAPDGSTHVIHGPQDATQLNGTTGQYGQPPGTVPVQNSTLDTGQNGGTTATDPAGNGTQPPDTGGSTTPLGGDISQSGMQQTGLPQTQTPPPDTPIEHLHGTGDHAAQADLAMFGPGTHMPATVTHHNPDGSTDITIPKGQDNPHAITVHVKPNDDGSLDITVPKSETNPHEIKIHVQPDKHVDLNITQDKDGHLKIDAHDHPPDQKGDWPGLKQPAGQGAGNPGDPNNPALPQAPQMPETPKMPGGGGGAPPGGGGGGPSGGGVPTAGGAPSSGVPTTRTTQPASTQPDGTLDVDSATIKKRGTDLVHGPVKTLDTAVGHARGIGIGYPGLGLLGSPLQMIHGSVTDSAAMELEQGSTTLSSSAQSLAQTGTIYENAEHQNTTTVQNNKGKAGG